MRDSVFRTVANYVKDVARGIRSLWGSLATALPYMTSIRSGDLRREVTEQYPDPISSRTADDLPARARGLLYNDIERCTGCGECQLACPVGCIQVETEAGADASKRWVSVFNVDFARCTFCGLCVETCQPQSLVHTKQFEGAVYNLRDLVAAFGRGRVTDEQRAKWVMLRKLELERGITP